MTTTTIKSISFAALFMAFMVPLTMLNSQVDAVNEDTISEKELMEHYEKQYGTDSNVPDHIKQEIARFELGLVEPHGTITFPEKQAEVGAKAFALIEQIKTTDDTETKAQLKKELRDMTGEMLRAGIVPTDWHDARPAYWDKEVQKALGNKEAYQYNDDPLRVSYQTVSSHDYRAGKYHKFWCYNWTLTCTSTTIYKDMNYGDTFYAMGTLPGYASYGLLEGYHQAAKKTSGAEWLETHNWMSVQNDQNQWVDTHCADVEVNIYFSGLNDGHSWRYCVSSESSPGNKVHSTLYLSPP